MFHKIRQLFVSNSKELKHYENIDGWLTPNEANGLFEMASILPKGSIVLEIGSWKGKSTWCIGQGLNRGVINCIDPFNAAGEEGSKEIYEETKGDRSLLVQFKENLLLLPAKVEVIALQGYSNEFVGKIKKIDFLFIDGDHSIEGCRFDFENFANEVKSGGYVAFHDHYPERQELGSTWVIDNIVRADKKYIHYKDFDSLCVFKKL